MHSSWISVGADEITFAWSTSAQSKAAALNSINIRAGSRERLFSGSPGSDWEGSQKRRSGGSTWEKGTGWGLDQGDAGAEVQCGRVGREECSSLIVSFTKMCVCVQVCGCERLNDPQYQRKLHTLRVILWTRLTDLVF